MRVALRTDDSGEQFNRVRRFDVIGLDEPVQDVFAPVDDDDGPKGDTESKAEPSGADVCDTTFHHGANASESAADAAEAKGGKS